MISATILLKSQSPHCGSIITTFELVYPRFIHAQVLTHRVFSRNAASSRAIPIEKLCELVEADPARPVAWGSNKAGMQAGEALGFHAEAEARMAWAIGARHAVATARRLAAAGCHKQICNRVLEPYLYQKTILTATDWDNWYELRLHDAAQPEIQYLARAMCDADMAAEPVIRQWHMPLAPDGPPSVSAARCARVSYARHLEDFPIEKDIARAEQLAKDKHWSPFEHPAEAVPGRWANYTGWQQLRYRYEQANVE